ncbi:MAG: hypothetical protein IPK99_03745 [Flavobacteriales bacterium]|nr:hypothetical protein [Flavobacteriales bacterium]
MSGSGSSVFGLFQERPAEEHTHGNRRQWILQPQSKIKDTDPDPATRIGQGKRPLNKALASLWSKGLATIFP